VLRRKKNICGHWDCNKEIPDGDFLCTEHHEKWVDGLIDRCPKCGRFKDIKYYLCLDCYFGRPIKKRKAPAAIPEPKQYPRIEFSDAWTDGYMSHNRRYIYVFEFDDEVFYVGHTADISEVLSKFRERTESSIVAHNPRLQYIEAAVSEEAAELRESELKKMILSNPDQMRMMATDFHNRMRELGLEEDS
jgi:predicted GIY-YIG superfamily endonuclease